ncbi:hypothetical protein D3C76_1702170 [compost metagenome]
MSGKGRLLILLIEIAEFDTVFGGQRAVGSGLGNVRAAGISRYLAVAELRLVWIETQLCGNGFA